MRQSEDVYYWLNCDYMKLLANLGNKILSVTELDPVSAPDICTLAEEVLTKKELNDARLITSNIALKGACKNKAIAKLQHKIGVKPKRPLYYITVMHLPYIIDNTRDIIRYLGDYIDKLIEYAAKDLCPNNILLRLSLGPKLNFLKGKIPDKLFNELATYNKVFYVAAKHDFDVDESLRNHRFLYPEVVLAVFITIKLADEIKTMSRSAMLYSSDKIY